MGHHWLHMEKGPTGQVWSGMSLLACCNTGPFVGSLQARLMADPLLLPKKGTGAGSGV